MEEENDLKILIEIDREEYDYYIDAEEWGEMEGFEREEFLTNCEMEARERYCETRTSVHVYNPDGTKVEI